MSLGTQQEIFSYQLVQLLTKAFADGFDVRIGEVWRPQEMQEIYLRDGRSKTRNSQHTKKLAADLHFFIAGRMATIDEIRPLGKYWEALDSANRWGGSWRGLIESGQSTFVDAPHFERRS